MAATILRRLGYTVLVASGGADALAVFARTSTPIDLLLTDVVMPRMSGVELAERLVEDGLVRRVADHGYGLMQKPFNPERLIRHVREVLDGVPVSAG